MTTAMFLHPDRVKEMIQQAGREDEVIVIRCVRKGKASKPGGPDAGDLYDLHCTKKPEDYTPVSKRNRRAEDSSNGVFTVYVTNRRGDGGNWGTWRRVNIEEVKKVIYKSVEYEVSVH